MDHQLHMPSRLTLTATFTVAALLLGIIGAVAAGTGTVTPPPKIAFVTTNANVAPDALTVGPMAGRLGAPLFITNSDNLNDDVKTALVAYGPDLIIVAGGPNTVTDGVLAQISAATGLDIKDIADTPSDGIVRVAGSGRDQTAVALSELIAAYNPKFLPTDATAADADLLDGKDSTAFLGATAKATDSNLLDGMDSTAFLGATAKAADANKLDGLDSSAFVTASSPLGFDFVQVEVVGAPENGDTVTLATLSVTTPDECGGGTTVHTYRLLASAFVQNDDGAVLGEDAFPRWSIVQDSTTLSFSTASGFQIDRLTITDGDMDGPFDYGVMHSQSIQTATPGSHDFNLVGNVWSGAFPVLFADINYAIEDMGYTCT